MTTASLTAKTLAALQGPTGTDAVEKVTADDNPPTEPADGQEPSPAGAEEGAETPEGQPKTEIDLEKEPGESDPKEEGEENDEAVSKQWPEKAIDVVTKLRGERRELKAKAEGLAAENEAHARSIEQLQADLAEARAAKPLAATPENPLAFITTAKAAQEFADAAQERARLFEDFLDGSLEGEAKAAVETFAKQAGGVDENGETSRAWVKKQARLAQDALARDLPKRLDYIQNESKLSAQADEVFPLLKDRKSQFYQDTQQAIATIPELKKLPHWKTAAAVFALGLAEYRKGLAATGKNGKAAAGAKPPGPAKLPGAPRSLPVRSPNGKTEATEALRAKATKAGASSKDVEAYTRSLLMG